MLATSVRTLGLLDLSAGNRNQPSMVLVEVFPTWSRGKTILDQSANALNRLLALVFRIAAPRFKGFIADAHLVRRLEAFSTTHLRTVCVSWLAVNASVVHHLGDSGRQRPSDPREMRGGQSDVGLAKHERAGVIQERAAQSGARLFAIENDKRFSPAVCCEPRFDGFEPRLDLSLGDGPRSMKRRSHLQEPRDASNPSRSINLIQVVVRTKCGLYSSMI